ncbi:hypothetical protein F5890DRAFT_1602357 [Lentinula detonsa]|uniref:Uncharacterized protein n=1 Tax=Lentinula detonsa TaxID=2804962 RepID=A0AA38ULF6_9AGAR|nr:hypothetical protein F5890DRAFT_1602357 [Lentinula detonsa]
MAAVLSAHIESSSVSITCAAARWSPRYHCNLLRHLEGQQFGERHDLSEGESVTKMLQTFNHWEENIILQIALQALMCVFREWMMTAWCYHDRDSGVELVLQETYEQLQEADKLRA